MPLTPTPAGKAATRVHSCGATPGEAVWVQDQGKDSGVLSSNEAVKNHFLKCRKILRFVVGGGSLRSEVIREVWKGLRHILGSPFTIIGIRTEHV